MTDTKARLTESLNLGLLVPELLFVGDLARVLHVTPSAVRTMLRAGVLQGKKLGRRWIVTRAGLMRILSPAPVGFRLLPQGGSR